MPIELTCFCGRELYLRDELAGLTIRCPACAGMLQVPVADEEIVETVPVGPPPLPKARTGPPPLPRPKLADEQAVALLPEPAPPTPAPPAAESEEEIPEFETLEVLDEPEPAVQSAERATQIPDVTKVEGDSNNWENCRFEGESTTAADPAKHIPQSRRAERYHADNWDTNRFQDHATTRADLAEENAAAKPLEELELENCGLRDDEPASTDQVKDRKSVV